MIVKVAGVTYVPLKCTELSNAIIYPILIVIFNRCITEDIFPDDLKIAQIIPIFKKGSKALCGNCRLISVLSPFKQMSAYLLKNKLIVPH